MHNKIIAYNSTKSTKPYQTELRREVRELLRRQSGRLALQTLDQYFSDKLLLSKFANFCMIKLENTESSVPQYEWSRKFKTADDVRIHWGRDLPAGFEAVIADSMQLAARTAYPNLIETGKQAQSDLHLGRLEIAFIIHARINDRGQVHELSLPTFRVVVGEDLTTKVLLRYLTNQLRQNLSLNREALAAGNLTKLARQLVDQANTGLQQWIDAGSDVSRYRFKPS